MKEWTTRPEFMSPLVDHLPKVAGVPSPKDVLGHHIGEPKKLTYYADILKYYRALAAASPRVKVLNIGKTDEGRELVVVVRRPTKRPSGIWSSTAATSVNWPTRGRSPRPGQARSSRKAKPIYHLIGGLHSGETGPLRNADGAGVSAGRGRLADHQPDPR